MGSRQQLCRTQASLHSGYPGNCRLLELTMCFVVTASGVLMYVPCHCSGCVLLQVGPVPGGPWSLTWHCDWRAGQLHGSQPHCMVRLTLFSTRRGRRRGQRAMWMVLKRGGNEWQQVGGSLKLQCRRSFVVYWWQDSWHPSATRLATCIGVTVVRAPLCSAPQCCFINYV